MSFSDLRYIQTIALLERFVRLESVASSEVSLANLSVRHTLIVEELGGSSD
jgi:hypothetical protein